MPDRAPKLFIVLLMTWAVITVARSGHEMPVYPSYYPHEIEIATISPDQAAGLLRDGKIQAFVGSQLRLGIAPSEPIRAIESLGSLVIVRVNPAWPLAKDEQSRCALTRAVLIAMSPQGGELVVHPYPVTPLHGDFLHHLDLAEAAKSKLLDAAASPPPFTSALRVRASDEVTKSLLPQAWVVAGAEWDAEVASVSTADLVRSTRTEMNGWSGPPWMRTGWFQAYLLLRGALDDSSRQRSEELLQRLKPGVYESAVERINLERELVAGLTAGCRALVAGYTVKREYFNAEFSAGIENIGFDALDGFNSPIFIRTVKLKDFPWNGWLALGIGERPSAAWNPIAGFSDDFGRLMWSAVGDPAMLPSPYDSEWMLNRVSDVQAIQAKKPR
ncbi:MAG: hypothetical protein M3R18_07050 [Pseudomonadota bacterium]|nr:hypothetical protein [Pseudomonadota bacterium]